MQKSLTAVLFAAAAAAVVMLVTPPAEKITPAAMHTCAERPWPYLNCVGTRFGNPKIRLVTTDRLR